MRPAQSHLRAWLRRPRRWPLPSASASAGTAAPSGTAATRPGPLPSSELALVPASLRLLGTVNGSSRAGVHDRSLPGGSGAGPQAVGDLRRPALDLGPVPEVPLRDPQRHHDRLLAKAELPLVELAGEHPM